MRTTAEQTAAQIAHFGFWKSPAGTLQGNPENMTCLKANHHAMTSDAIKTIAEACFLDAADEARELDALIAVHAEEDGASDDAHGRMSEFNRIANGGAPFTGQLWERK